MAEAETNAERERRITDETIVDACGPEVQTVG